MNIIGYKTFYWTELAKLLGLNVSSRATETVELRAADFLDKPSAYSPDSQALPQTLLREEGWYCVGVLEDNSLDINGRLFGNSRGEAVEKFFKTFLNHRAYWSDEENEAISNGYLKLYNPSLRCLDLENVGWVKLG